MSLPLFSLPLLGRLFVVSGPSGVGKGTALNLVLSRIDNIELSISATTRSPRPGELDGVAYHFFTQAQFEAAIAQKRFLEYARYNNNYYGTPRDNIQSKLDAGIDVILEIEVQGAHLVKQQLPKAVLIYIQPPSLAELERRLRERKSETEETICKRLLTAQAEQESIPFYNYLITNDRLEAAVEALCAIVTAERHRIPASKDHLPENRQP